MTETFIGQGQTCPEGPAAAKPQNRTWVWGVLGLVVMLGWTIFNSSEFQEAFERRISGGNASDAVPTTTDDQSGTASNPGAAALHQMDEQRRGAALRNVVISAGESCGGPVRAVELGASSGAVMFAVGCANGKDFIVQVKANESGSTSVLPCETYKAVSGARDCFTKF